jgi:arabinose operon protein AraL
MLKTSFHQYNTFIFDLDGTLLLQEELFTEAISLISFLVKQNKQILFISNNTTKSLEQNRQIFLSAGLSVEKDQFILAGDVLLKRLNIFKVKHFYLIGEDVFKDQLEENGFFFTEKDNKIEIVIVTLDRNYSDSKFKIAEKAIKYGALLVAANIDKSCPTNSGEIIDAGIIINELIAATKVNLSENFGKPSKHFFAELASKLIHPNKECLLIGDRLETDIKLGNDNNIDTVLVNSGVHNDELLKNKIIPKYELKSIVDIFETDYIVK